MTAESDKSHRASPFVVDIDDVPGKRPSAAATAGNREYLRELDRFRGRPRVWVVFAHALPSLAEQPTIRGYLGHIGKRREGFEAVGAAADLYDLSEPERLQSSTAETYPLSQGNSESDASYWCGHGPLAAAPPDWK